MRSTFILILLIECLSIHCGLCTTNSSYTIPIECRIPIEFIGDCPQLINVPKFTCRDEPMICLDFDCPVSQVLTTTISLVSSNAFGSEISRDGNTICFNLPIIESPDPAQVCSPWIVHGTLSYDCVNGESFTTTFLVTYFTGNIHVKPRIVEFECGEPSLSESQCGSLVINQYIPANNDCDNLQDGIIFYSIVPDFSYEPIAACYDLEGTVVIPACCDTEVICPLPILSNPIPDLCDAEEEIEFCIEFDNDISIIRNFQFFKGSCLFNVDISYLNSENKICISGNTYFFRDCFQSCQSSVFYQCSIDETLQLTFLYNLYPNPSKFIPSFENVDGCNTPLFDNPECGEIVSYSITPGNNDCDNLDPGTIDFVIDPGFDMNDAPPCFDIQTSFSYPPCTAGCPCSAYNGFISIKSGN